MRRNIYTCKGACRVVARRMVLQLRTLRPPFSYYVHYSIDRLFSIVVVVDFGQRKYIFRSIIYPDSSINVIVTLIEF